MNSTEHTISPKTHPEVPSEQSVTTEKIHTKSLSYESAELTHQVLKTAFEATLEFQASLDIIEKNVRAIPVVAGALSDERVPTSAVMRIHVNNVVLHKQSKRSTSKRFYRFNVG